jgi:hypothetical protein
VLAALTTLLALLAFLTALAGLLALAPLTGPLLAALLLLLTGPLLAATLLLLLTLRIVLALIALLVRHGTFSERWGSKYPPSQVDNATQSSFVPVPIDRRIINALRNKEKSRHRHARLHTE